MGKMGSTAPKNESSARIKGIYHDVLYDSEGRILEDRGLRSNTILDGCRLLLSGFMKNETTGGITGLAVGQGDAAWDTTGAPAPNPATTTGLVNRYNPVIPFSALDVVYLDQNDQVVVGPSTRLQMTATLTPGYPIPTAPSSSYALREFGLLAMLNGSEVMINNIRHPVLHKDAASTLIRVIRLYF